MADAKDRFVVRCDAENAEYEVVDDVTGVTVDGWSDHKYAERDCLRRNRIWYKSRRNTDS